MLDIGRLGGGVACLTLDVEQDFGGRLEEPSYEGLLHVSELVDSLRVKGLPLTCFVQGSLLETHPSEIEQLTALDAEFQLHSFSHPNSRRADVKYEVERGKEAYVRFFAREPLGYRAPLGIIEPEDYDILASHGFAYDSSIFPSLRPGVFNNLAKPITPYFLNDSRMVEFPFAVFSRFARVPLTLSYIKLLGRPSLNLLKMVPCPGLVVIDFHLHDLFKLDSSRKFQLENLPFVYRRVFKRIYRNGKWNGLRILDELTTLLQKKGYAFSKLIDVYEAICR